jgi:hypothetical protein
VLRSIRHEHIANDEAGANLNSRAALEESPEMVMMTTVALSRYNIPTGRRAVTFASLVEMENVGNEAIP